MATLNLVIASASRLAGNLKPFSIVNPVVGSSGIYQITDDAGNKFDAYVDMVTDGGFWIQVARWTGAIPAGSVVGMDKMLVKDNNLVGYSANPSTNPSVPAGRILKNPAKEFMFQSDASVWKTLYGNWMVGQLFPAGTTMWGVDTAMPVRTSIGNKNVYGARSGWRLDTDLRAIPLSFWTINNANGPCGGSGRTKTGDCCPMMDANAAGYNAHCDYVNMKRFYLRAANYPG